MFEFRVFEALIVTYTRRDQSYKFILYFNCVIFQRIRTPFVNGTG